MSGSQQNSKILEWFKELIIFWIPYILIRKITSHFFFKWGFITSSVFPFQVNEAAPFSESFHSEYPSNLISSKIQFAPTGGEGS